MKYVRTFSTSVWQYNWHILIGHGLQPPYVHPPPLPSPGKRHSPKPMQNNMNTFTCCMHKPAPLSSGMVPRQQHKIITFLSISSGFDLSKISLTPSLPLWLTYRFIYIYIVCMYKCMYALIHALTTVRMRHAALDETLLQLHSQNGRHFECDSTLYPPPPRKW